MQSPHVDGNRLWSAIMAMGEIGATSKGGSRRVAFSEEDRRGRALFHRWCDEAGLAVTVDLFGNMFARRAGTADLPPVQLGSHLDTQPTGGKFDGVFGVLAALEAVRTLDDAGRATRRPIEIVNWTNEEGAIYTSLLGSKVFTGTLALDEALEMRDLGGRRCADALDGIGARGSADRRGMAIHAYLEAHIEQGPILERHGVPIGVVTGATAYRSHRVSIEGRDAHAGSTPMEMRRDAMVAAARIIVAGTEMARGIDGGRATFGWVEPHPGVSNTLAGRVEMSADLRHPDEAVLERMGQELATAFAAVDALEKTTSTLTRTITSPAVHFDAEVCGLIEAAAGSLGLAHERLVSGALHDACSLASVTRAAMIFIPCRDGLSHNEAEYASPEACEAGCNVLLRAALAAADED